MRMGNENGGGDDSFCMDGGTCGDWEEAALLKHSKGYYWNVRRGQSQKPSNCVLCSTRAVPDHATPVCVPFRKAGKLSMGTLHRM